MTRNTFKRITVLLTAGMWIACQAEQAPMPTPVASDNVAQAGEASPIAEQQSTPPVKQTPTTGESVMAVKSAEPEKPFKGKKLAFIHTSNMVGELEPCG